VFNERLIACHAKVEAFGITLPSLDICTMKRRWGSCAPGIAKGNALGAGPGSQGRAVGWAQPTR